MSDANLTQFTPVRKSTHHRFVDREGQRFGRLLAVGYAGTTEKGEGGPVEASWFCRCECGNIRKVRSSALRSGQVVSCGKCHYGDDAPPDDARPIPLADGYMVADGGGVWSCRRVGIGDDIGPWRKLKPSPDKDGYLRVEIGVGGKRSPIPVHRLVLEAFVGPCPDGMEGCHNDGNRENNFLSNLRWDTSLGNMADKHKHGTTARGARIATAKITETDVREIFRLSRQGFIQSEIAQKIGICQTNVSRILTRSSWGHVDIDSDPSPTSPDRR